MLALGEDLSSELKRLASLIKQGKDVNVADFGCGDGAAITELTVFLNVIRELYGTRGRITAVGVDVNPMPENLDQDEIVDTIDQILSEMELDGERAEFSSFRGSTITIPSPQFEAIDVKTLPEGLRGLDFAISLETAQYLDDKLGFVGDVISRIRSEGLAVITGVRDYLVYVKDISTQLRVPFKLALQASGAPIKYDGDSRLAWRANTDKVAPFSMFKYKVSVASPIPGERCSDFERLCYYDLNPRRDS